MLTAGLEQGKKVVVIGEVVRRTLMVVVVLALYGAALRLTIWMDDGFDVPPQAKAAMAAHQK